MAALSSFDRCYSIAGVVLTQLRVLVRYKVPTVLLVTDDFKDHELVPEGVEIRYYPRYRGNPTVVDRGSFQEYAFTTSSVLSQALQDCKVCFTHDLMFIKEFLPVNMAIREVKTRVKWYHWIHSAPSKHQDLEWPENFLYTGHTNSNMVYVNQTDIRAVAEMYAVPYGSVRVVHNIIDPVVVYKMCTEAEDFINTQNLLSKDIVCVFPTRITPAKQIDKIISIFEQIKLLGRSVSLIICNSYSNSDTEKELIASLQSSVLGSDLVFTSQLTTGDYSLGVPHEFVLDLLKISDVFIMPSISEGCSLTMLEAGITKNHMVLNYDLHSFFEFGGQTLDNFESQRSLYLPFGSVRVQRALESGWANQYAVKLLQSLEHSKSYQFSKHIRQYFNPKYVFENQIAPLING